MIKADIIADSLNPHGDRITTFVATFPRIILAELNTHRMLSRNSASSRAIPAAKMVEAVRNNPFIPLKWMKDHKGMQGNEYFDKNDPRNASCRLEWLKARDSAVHYAEILNKGIGLTKQIANRLLEPWMWHTAIITATEFENFFALRAESGAEIHIQNLAVEMLYAMNESQPKQLRAGQWHIPFGDQIDRDMLWQTIGAPEGEIEGDADYYIDQAVLKVATARCAQVSYTVVGEDGKAMDYAKLIALHDRLAKAGHWSPFEHCARAMDDYEYHTHYNGVIEANEGESMGFSIDGRGWCGNFRGFVQYRKMFANENRKDSRLFKP